MKKIQPVSNIKRSLHYIVDYNAIPFVLGMLSGFFESDINSKYPSIYIYILIFANFFVLEPLTGKTVAKYITKTTSVTVDGKKISFSRGVLKAFTRLIPFDLFSFFFSKYPVGWHDKVSKTLVVEDILVRK